MITPQPSKGLVKSCKVFGGPKIMSCFTDETGCDGLFFLRRHSEVREALRTPLGKALRGSPAVGAPANHVACRSICGGVHDEGGWQHSGWQQSPALLPLSLL